MDTKVQVISNLRACMLSVSGGLTMPTLVHDYRMLVGGPIPFRDLGFDTLESFLRSIPDLALTKRNGELFLDAVPSKDTEHLAALVSRQKSAPKKFKSPKGAPRRTAVHLRARLPVKACPPRYTAPARSFPPARSTFPPPRPVKPNVSITVNTGPTTSRQVVVGDGPDVKPMNDTAHKPSNRGDGPEPTSRHQYDTPPRFLRKTITQNTEKLVLNSQISIENSVTAPKSYVNVTSSRTPTPPISPTTAPVDILPNPAAKTKTLPIPPLNTYPANGITDRMDYKDELTRVVKERYGPDCIVNIKIVPRYPKGELPICAAVVKVNDTSYYSYPEEDHSPDVVVQIACKRALFEIMDSDGNQNFPATKDVQLVKSRVIKIVEAHPSGIWNTQIPVDYSSQYNESLPIDWFSIVRNCPEICAEHVASNRFILIVKSPTEEKQAPTPPPSVPMPRTPKQHCVTVLDELELPDDEQWDVFVTYALSTNEVWIRLLGDNYSVQYDSMSTDMEIYYMGSPEKVIEPVVGCFYAVKVDDCWHRVKLEEITSKDTGLVFFVDHGDEDLLNLDMLYVLEDLFTNLPCQALLVSLSGLEDFSSDPNAGKHLVDTIIGRALVAEVVSREPLSLTLFDTSTEDDVNLNQLLAERMCEEVLAPTLPENGNIVEVYLSHVNDTGDVYLHVRSESFKYLETLMRKAVNQGQLAPSSFDSTKLQLARYSVDTCWYRAKVISEVNDKNQVMVQFVDYGNTEETLVKDLVPLEQLSLTLASFPQQALRVHLHDVPPALFGKKMASRLQELVGEDTPLLVRVKKNPGNGLPLEVELFKRIENQQIISLNNTLALDPELRPKPVDPHPPRRTSSQRLPSLSDLDGNGPSKLLVPQIPAPGQFFDVQVSLAANPSNFNVQPLAEIRELEMMMAEMQEYYYNSVNVQQVLPEHVREGAIFAALHDVDETWYRVTVSNLLFNTMVSVFFCDFGDVSMLALEKLRPLAPQFKKLPSLSIKARLSTIVPCNGDWSVEDCIRFQELVSGKKFVSIITDSAPDALTPKDIVLGVQLIDTSNAADLFIDQILVEENRANFVAERQLPQPQQQLPNARGSAATCR